MQATLEVESIKRSVLNISTTDIADLGAELQQAPNYADVTRPDRILTRSYDLGAIIISKQELISLQEIGLDPECVQPERLTRAVHTRLAEYSRDKPITLPLLPIELVPIPSRRGRVNSRAALVIARNPVFVDERRLAKNAIREAIQEPYGTLTPEIISKIDKVWPGDYFAGVKLATAYNRASQELLGHLRTSILSDHRLLAPTVELGPVEPKLQD